MKLESRIEKLEKKAAAAKRSTDFKELNAQIETLIQAVNQMKAVAFQQASDWELKSMSQGALIEKYFPEGAEKDEWRGFSDICTAVLKRN
jgi:hypothetical protein